MKKLFVILGFLFVAAFFAGCSDDDSNNPDIGKGAVYQLVIKQSGDYKNFTKSVVIAVNGSDLKDDQSGEIISKRVFDNTDLMVSVFSVSTEGKAVQFAISGGVADLDEEVNQEMTWDITVKKDGKQIDHKTYTFQDGHDSSGLDVNLYYD